MSEIVLLHPSSLSGAPAPRRRLSVLSVLGLTLLLGACRAPGMKFNTQAYDKETHTQVNGQDVTLHPLNPETLKIYGARPASTEVKELLATKPQPYRIGPQDILMVTVWDHPELTLPLGQYRTDAATGMVVNDSGYMFYPYIGRVKMAGLTVEDARDALTTKLDDVLQRPQVDLKVLAYRSQKVFVSGEVRNPAVYNITDIPFTLTEAINRAGGFLPTADESHVLVSRGDKTWSLDFLQLLTRGNRIGQILLQDGDSVHVQNRDEEPVYLLGELRNPRSVPTYHGKLSLAQAISDAGGINSTTAEARSIYVFRRGKAENAVDVFHLDAYNPVAMVLADRFALQPRDLVYVDAGPLVRWNRVVSLIVPTVSALTSTASEVKYLSQ
ncbi:polysaccharide biosynthesis/export family protein [Geothrix fuzhouensis]|uniref:polysaccharide biosynthesis/export family protein n=1 Tax=Geothrix fuzhouensis TaxID=2966451 RepID=UPI0021492888|nr:polysaccharide biosynthesis/export family protein [Geothrix fuzhouensis]